jgi:alkaline phosphatase
MKRNFFFLTALSCFFLFVSGCSDGCQQSTPPKYVFLFIGDGMGFAQITAAENYLSEKNNAAGSGSLSFTGFPVMGMVTTYSANTLVTCSAAAATALGTGCKTNNGMLGTAPDSSNLTSFTYPLHQAGYRIGIASSVGIDHATPGGFYANSVKRNDYYRIARQVSTTGFEFFAGSGFSYPTGKDGQQPDAYQQLAAAGYTIVQGRDAAEKITAPAGKTVLVQTPDKPVDALPYAIERSEDDLTLPLITQAAINALYNKDGFFAMIEGGKIDWAAHVNDGATVIHEVIDFSEAVRTALAFYNQHPDETLIIVTADHETGGLSVGSQGVYAFRPLAFDEQTKSLSIHPDKQEKEWVESLNEKALCGWTSTNHTGVVVPIFAIGAGSERFAGKMDNTDIPKRLCALMGIQLPAEKQP